MIFHNQRPSIIEKRKFPVVADRPMAMLKQCPAYTPTPIIDFPQLAQKHGVSSIQMKDESKRMGLGSFKALGGAYAVAQLICDEAGATDPMSEAAKSAAENMTFVTASAGNHGLSVSTGAKLFGAKAIIVLAEAVPEGFADRIRALGADVVRTKGAYEASVEEAMRISEHNNWIHLADGSWPGYEERPAIIIEGYMVLAEELKTYYSEHGNWPTHIFLQAGVGGLAVAVAAHAREHWEEQPVIIVVEPDAAPCLMKSAEAGELTRVEGPESNMGRLDCKEASLINFHALNQDTDIFVTVSDEEAQAATEMMSGLGHQSTPSGVAAFAALDMIDMDKDSRVLMFLSEGLEDA